MLTDVATCWMLEWRHLYSQRAANLQCTSLAVPPTFEAPTGPLCSRWAKGRGDELHAGVPRTETHHQPPDMPLRVTWKGRAGCSRALHCLDVCRVNLVSRQSFPERGITRGRGGGWCKYGCKVKLRQMCCHWTWVFQLPRRSSCRTEVH